MISQQITLNRLIRQSTAEKEHKISISNPNVTDVQKHLYIEESFSKIDKPEFVVENSNICEKNIFSVNPLPNTSEKYINVEKEHMHDFECQDTKHDDKNEVFPVYENKVKEDNSKMIDTQLLEDEDLGVN